MGLVFGLKRNGFNVFNRKVQVRVKTVMRRKIFQKGISDSILVNSYSFSYWLEFLELVCVL